MTIQNKIVVILGAGESGVGAAILAQKMGATVFVSDFGKIAPDYKAELIQFGLAWEEETHSMDRVIAADLIIKSPGIPEKSPVMKAVREKGIRVVSEIEFAGYFTTAKKVCSFNGLAPGAAPLLTC